MLFQVHISVALAVQPTWQKEFSIDSQETAESVFGINADSYADAVQMAIQAAERAQDRNGDFIGGVVLQVICRAISANAFEGYETSFHAASDVKGIFYVSGTKSRGTFDEEMAAVKDELHVLRGQIAQSGLPVISFVHPPLQERPPRLRRVLCPACNHWAEINDSILLWSLADGLDPARPEDKAALDNRHLLTRFFERHNTRCLATIVNIDEGDPRWTSLDPRLEEHLSDY